MHRTNENRGGITFWFKRWISLFCSDWIHFIYRIVIIVAIICLTISCIDRVFTLNPELYYFIALVICFIISFIEPKGLAEREYILKFNQNWLRQQELYYRSSQETSRFMEQSQSESTGQAESVRWQRRNILRHDPDTLREDWKEEEVPVDVHPAAKDRHVQQVPVEVHAPDTRHVQKVPVEVHQAPEDSPVQDAPVDLHSEDYGGNSDSFVPDCLSSDESSQQVSNPDSASNVPVMSTDLPTQSTRGALLDARSEEPKNEESLRQTVASDSSSNITGSSTDPPTQSTHSTTLDATDEELTKTDKKE